ncbi:NADH-cytochrome b5 reductase-like isoform X1 [Apteryx mantelli]|uniref:NADH-cytochrome b5 reductase-like isoform X1 n=1 Tax=Apteryx mantelli TaxID=2696672 RepID=A0ABM4EXF6_9AVES
MARCGSEDDWAALRPREPAPSQCCGGGCRPCVYDAYEEALARWERARAARDTSLLAEKERQSNNSELNPDTFTAFSISSVEQLTEDTYQYKFELPGNSSLRLSLGQHIVLRGVVNGLEVQRAYTPISPGNAEGYFEVLIKIMQSGAFGGFYRTPSSHLRLGCSFSGFSVASLLPARRLERVGAAAVLPPPPAACGSSSTHVPPPWPRGPDDYLERRGCWGGPAVFGPLPAPLFLASAGPFSSVTSECYEAGLMSQYIKTWKKGDMVFWRGPFGGFPYRPNKYGELLMLASGTGLAPMLPILQSITENEEDETFVTLVGCFRSFGNIYLKPLLQELARYWNIRIFYVLSQESSLEKLPWSYQENTYTGRLNEDLMKTIISSCRRKPFVLICGSSAFNEDMSRYLKSAGLEENSCFVF